MNKQKPRTAPRDIVPGKSWYYVNRGSIDMITTVVVEGLRVMTNTRLKRQMLQSMLAELRPIRPKETR